MRTRSLRPSVSAQKETPRPLWTVWVLLCLGFCLNPGWTLGQDQPTPPSGKANEAKRAAIRLPGGDRVIGRVYGESGGASWVILPDGRIGRIQNEIVYANEPFQPWTKEQVRDELLKRPEYQGFRARITKHYVIITNASEKFIDNSSKLLESLYEGLLKTLKEWKLDVHEAEFPLPAIVYAEEEQFRARQPIAPEVQAYFDIQSNHIVFYENAAKNQAAPEIFEMLKPQTVAHEGTHQILQNIGLHNRLSPWPIWIIEGMADYCSPTGTKKGAEWAGVARINPLHMATIRNINDPITQQLRSLGVEPKPLKRNPNTPLVEHLVKCVDLNPTEYALAWAQTHYLAAKKPKEFRAYLAEMSKLKPFAKVTPQEHWETFQRIFNRAAVKLDADITKHIAGLKNYEPLPYYAILFEHPLPGGRIRRAAFVSQSPSIIQQQLNDIRVQLNNQVRWQAVSCPTRSQAMVTAERLLNAP